MADLSKEEIEAATDSPWWWHSRTGSEKIMTLQDFEEQRDAASQAIRERTDDVGELAGQLAHRLVMAGVEFQVLGDGEGRRFITGDGTAEVRLDVRAEHCGNFSGVLMRILGGSGIASERRPYNHADALEALSFGRAVR